METILHFLGICPDSLSHLDVLDILTTYSYQIFELITNLTALKRH